MKYVLQSVLLLVMSGEVQGTLDESDIVRLEGREQETAWKIDQCPSLESRLLWESPTVRDSARTEERDNVYHVRVLNVSGTRLGM